MRFDRRVVPAYAAAAVCLIASALGFRAAVAALGVYLKKEPVPLRASLDGIPTTLGAWKRVGEDRRYGDAIVEELGTSKYLNRLYAIDGDPSKGVVELHLAYYTGFIDTVPHVPERCWGAHGMQMTRQSERMPLTIDKSAWRADPTLVHQSSGKPYFLATVTDSVTKRSSEVHLPVDEIVLSVTEFQEQSRPQARFIGGYLFVANGRATPSPYEVRDLAFSLTDKYAYYCKVQFSAEFPKAEGAYDRYREQVTDLLGQVLPHLMRTLPDWPEYEQRPDSSRKTA